MSSTGTTTILPIYDDNVLSSRRHKKCNWLVRVSLGLSSGETLDLRPHLCRKTNKDAYIVFPLLPSMRARDQLPRRRPERCRVHVGRDGLGEQLVQRRQDKHLSRSARAQRREQGWVRLVVVVKFEAALKCLELGCCHG